MQVEDIYKKIYLKLNRMGVFDVRQYAVIENPPFTPLCIDRIADDCYALSQNRVEEGSVFSDPDVEIRVDHKKKVAEPTSFQDRSVRKMVYPKPGTVNLQIKNELAIFLERWLDDLLSKGFIRHQ